MSASTQQNSAADDRPLLPSKNSGLLMVAVMGISICQFLDLTIANVALPHMQTSLGASMESISWVLTSYIVAGVLVLPMTGWLSDRIGSRNLFVGSSILFVVASMLCGAATSLGEMVLFRALQGVAAAFIAPLSQTIIFDINRPSRQARAMSIWAMAVMIAPITGPFIGGYLTETFNWRWVFYVNLPIGLPAIAILWWLLPSRPRTERTLDVFGAATLALALVSLQLMLDRGQNKDWFSSPEIVAELVISLSAFWVFFVHSRNVRIPLFDRIMVRDPNFIMGLAFMTILGIANVGLAAVLPTLLQNVYGYDVMDSGLLMAPRGLGVLTTMIITNRLMAKVDIRILLTIGYLIAAYSLWMMTKWSLEMGSGHIMLTGYIQGLGLGLIFVPSNLLAFATLNARFRPDGATLMNLFRNIGSSIGISVIVTMLARNVQISHADIAGNVTSFNLPSIDPSATAATFGDVGGAGLALLDAAVNRQAAMIAYLDNFYLLFWVLLIFAPLAWLVKRPQVAGGNQPPPVE